MLSDIELEQLFLQWGTPPAGRKLIRRLRTDGPVRALQGRMDGVRTRLVSKKMGGRALLAESRTCEFPAVYIREHDPETVELWPQPFQLDLKVEGPNGTTRVLHMPDLFLIEHGFIVEEWREEVRLLKLAMKSPHRYYKDSEGAWHDTIVEPHLKALGITYRLRSSDEHPRAFLSNLSFLEEYALESCPPVAPEVRTRLVALLKEHNVLPHTALVHEHGFSADDVFKLLIEGCVYVDLHATVLHRTEQLLIYRDKAVAQADAILNRPSMGQTPSSVLALSVGSRFLFDEQRYEITLLGRNQVIAKNLDTGGQTTLDVSLVEQLFQRDALASITTQPTPPQDKSVLFNEKRLGEALGRLTALEEADTTATPKRTLRRWAKRIQGITSPQDQLDALISRNPGNTSPRLPEEVLNLAIKATKEFHNTVKKPTVAGTYSFYVNLCTTAEVEPMSRSNFYRWMARHSSVKLREGKRMAYQKAPIPLSYDFEHPVHGVLPHEVCYCDHTIINQFLKGERSPDLGKPTITLMVDGGTSQSRGFYLSYRPASAVSVLMCLRDYVRRNGRLPRILVLDNGKEFHSTALAVFCSMFGITIRWRRRSRPRDSSIIERMLGATEQEVIAQLDGNSLALKDPRMVSSSHQPQKHIKWTLPALYGALQKFLFEVHRRRVHPRFGISPDDQEKRLLLECGARDHVVVRYDANFKLLTSPHPETGKPHRTVDRMRGVYVDGMWYWHERLAQARPGETAVVRVEPWCASTMYVNFKDEWLIAKARDGSLDGRFRMEFQQQRREESRTRKSLAQKDKNSSRNAAARVELWDPTVWDERLRAQGEEMYYVYSRLGMTEVDPEGRNSNSSKLFLGEGSNERSLLEDAQKEPELRDNGDEEEDGDGNAPTGALRTDSKSRRSRGAAPAPAQTAEATVEAPFFF